MGLAKVHVVEDAEEHPKGHVRDPKDDRHLHLEGVEKAQVVRGQAPDRVNAKGIWSKEDTSDVRVQGEHGVLGQILVTPA